MFNKGGLRRTIEAPCGWRCVGHPREVNGKFNIHKRFCESCKEDNMEVPAFNRTNGDANGWNGITIKGHRGVGQVNRTYRTDCLVDGRLVNVETFATSVADATTRVRENEDIISAINLVSKNKKKRNNKGKAKTLVEHLREVESHTCEDGCDCCVFGKGGDRKNNLEELAAMMEQDRINQGGDPNCRCCIITADRLVMEQIDGSEYCAIIVK